MNSTCTLEKDADEAFEQFLKIDEWAQLEKAVELLQSLIENTEEDDVERVGRLSFKYSSCLRYRFLRGRAQAEIENAIMFAKTAIDNIPPLSTQDRCRLLAERQGLLCNCLINQDDSLSCSDPDAFKTAVDISQRIMDSLEAHEITGTDPCYIEAIHRVAISLRIQWDKTPHTSQGNLLKKSLEMDYLVYQSRLDDPPGEPQIEACSEFAYGLQRAYRWHLEAEQISNVESKLDGPKLESCQILEESLRNLRAAWDIPTEKRLSKVRIIYKFVEYIRELPMGSRGAMMAPVVDLLDESVSILGNVVQTALRFDQLYHIAEFCGISRYAAAATLFSGSDAYSALSVLERGRGIVLSAEIGQWRNSTEQDLLPPSVRQRLLKAEKMLVEAVQSQQPYTIREQLQNDLRLIEAEALREHGLSNARDILTKNAMQKLATAGPIIEINMTDIRSDAFIVTRDGVFNLSLEDLDEEDVSELSWEIQWRLAQEKGDDNKLEQEAHNFLQQMLSKLWRSAVKPVLDHLGYKFRTDAIHEWPQVCWIPTGVLNLYPLHAAGLGWGRPGNTLNRVISTYAPSLRALAQSQRHQATQSQHGDNVVSAAVLAMVKTGGLVPEDVWDHPEEAPERLKWGVLENSEKEVRILQHHFHDIQVDVEPTTARAIKVLQQKHTIVHISCHGYVNYIDPSNSMLLFKDWEEDPLTSTRLRELKIQSKLAVLSACFTANSGIDTLQDEMVQLTSILYISGFSNVVGSLWYVGEGYAKRFMESFYKCLCRQQGGVIISRNVAQAFHQAVLDLGASTCNDGNHMKGAPVLWAPFICVGI